MGIEVAAVWAAVVAWAAANGTAILVNLAISAALTIAANAIIGGPKAPKSAGYDKASRTGNIREALSAHEVVYGEVRKGGIVFYMNGTGSDNNILHICVALAAHECDSIRGIFLNGQQVELVSYLLPANIIPYNDPTLGPEYQMAVPASGPLRNFASFWWRLGMPNQTPIAGMVKECYNWTASHRARGICYVYARLVQDPSGVAWPSFVPAVTVKLKGKKDIFDPRTNTTGYSENPALIAADALQSFMGVPRARIHEPSLIEAANICDQLVTIRGGGTEKRYRCSGFFSLQGDAEEWLAPIARCMGGAIVEHHGIYYVRAGAYREPVATLTDRDIMGSVRLTTAETDRSRSNVVKGVFAGAESFGQPAEFPQRVLTSAVIEDGAENVLDLDLEFVPSHRQAQRIAKTALLSSRLDRTLEVGVSLELGLDVMPWDNLAVDIKALGIRGTFRIIEHKATVDGEPAALRPVLLLQETAASLWSWDAESEELPFSSSDYLLYQPGYTPSNLTYFLTEFTPPYGDFRPAKVNASWIDPTDEIPDSIDIESKLNFEYRASPESAWTPGTILLEATAAAGALGGEFIFELTDEAPTGLEFRLVEVEYFKIRSYFGGETYGQWVVA